MQRLSMLQCGSGHTADCWSGHATCMENLQWDPRMALDWRRCIYRMIGTTTSVFIQNKHNSAENDKNCRLSSPCLLTWKKDLNKNSPTCALRKEPMLAQEQK